MEEPQAGACKNSPTVVELVPMFFAEPTAKHGNTGRWSLGRTWCPTYFFYFITTRCNRAVAGGQTISLLPQ